MREATVTVLNEVGLHARPAATFVKTAQAFDADITVANLTRKSEPVDAKSIVQVFKIAVAQGHEILMTAEGSEEQLAIDTLVGLIESDFAK